MIDWTRVETLRSELGQQDFEEIVQLFLEESADVIARLRGDPSAARIEADLHFLRGSSMALGFRTFSDLCEAGESLLASGRRDAVDLPAILTAFDASKRMFLQGLPEVPADQTSL